jgi:hypothetical protein
MWGNFNEHQNLKNGDMTVDVRGWLRWDPEDLSAELTITIVQDGTECTAPPFTVKPPADTWRVEATRPAPPPWQRGAAAGRAKGVVTRKDGTTYEVDWDSPPLTFN